MIISGRRRWDIIWVAGISLVCTYILWCEYLPPFRRVHLSYDIHGYHYPLLQYAFDSVRHGRFPEWDPTIYCGLSFVGNVQAALFYPPNWLLFACNLGREHLSYKSLEALVFAHSWFAFVLCFAWLRDKGLGTLASVLGAGIFSFSGYMMSQNNHVGVVTGMAWTPLGLWGIDQAIANRNWRFLWKVVAASAMCFLAGYPPTWIVSCVCLVVYAAASDRTMRAFLGTGVAIAYSILVVFVQLLPAQEAAQLKTFDPKYGSGIKDPRFFVTLAVPNYYDFTRSPIGEGDPPAVYLYLGAPAFLGLLLLIQQRLRGATPGIAVGAVSLVGVTNPFNLVWELVRRSDLLSQMCHAFNFLEGITLSVALLSAVGLSRFLRKDVPRRSTWVTPIAITLLGVWAGRLWWISRPGPPDFASGLRAVAEPALMPALAALALWLLRREAGARRICLGMGLLVTLGVDCKVFGTNRGFNASPDDVDDWYKGGQFIGLDDAVYQTIRRHPESRILVGDTGPSPIDLRHYGLTTPQGFDPLLPQQYRSFIEREVQGFRTDRLFYVAPEHERLLALLGVRYFMLIDNSSFYPAFRENPNFRLLQPSGSFFKVFEYRQARPGYYWDVGVPAAAPIDRLVWLPERRTFRVRSERGGRLILAEQHFPGWKVRIDGQEATLERWYGTLQAVTVPPGQHTVEFRFQSAALRKGLLVTILALTGMVFAMRFRPAV